MELALSIITYLLIGIGLWLFGLIVGMSKLLYTAHYIHCQVRRNDVFQLIGLIILMAVLLIIIFIYPGLLWKIPATAAVLEIGSIPILYHITQNIRVNLHGLNQHLPH